jgi:hypothetical protein
VKLPTLAGHSKNFFTLRIFSLAGHVRYQMADILQMERGVMERPFHNIVESDWFLMVLPR